MANPICMQRTDYPILQKVLWVAKETRVLFDCSPKPNNKINLISDGPSGDVAQIKPILKSRSKYEFDGTEQPNVAPSGLNRRQKKVWFARPDLICEIPPLNKVPSYAKVLRSGGAVDGKKENQGRTPRGPTPNQKLSGNYLRDQRSDRRYIEQASDQVIGGNSDNANSNTYKYQGLNRLPLPSRHEPGCDRNIEIISGERISAEARLLSMDCYSDSLFSSPMFGTLLNPLDRILEPPPPIPLPPYRAHTIQGYYCTRQFNSEFERDSAYLDYLVHHQPMKTPESARSRTAPPIPRRSGRLNKPSSSSNTWRPIRQQSCASTDAYIPEVSALGGVPT